MTIMFNRIRFECTMCRRDRKTKHKAGGHQEEKDFEENVVEVRIELQSENSSLLLARHGHVQQREMLLSVHSSCPLRLRVLALHAAQIFKIFLQQFLCHHEIFLNQPNQARESPETV